MKTNLPESKYLFDDRAPMAFQAVLCLIQGGDDGLPTFSAFQKINGGSRGIWSGVTHVPAGLEGRHILVDSIYTRVYCAGFVAFHKPCFVRLEILHGNITVQTLKMPDRGEIGVDGICRGAPPLQEIMEIL